ncbi:MAG: aminotransferase class I/II-fold pyridoxal phosphate-dependent enzyme [Ignavibacteriales bacterium]|nr:aminotransferase class I/II-fold pyridoxal phosphate-dependent enzyme [Ignavibacteriales bacterium]
MNDELFINYLGPKAENLNLLKKLVNRVLDHQAEWRKSFFPTDPEIYPKEILENSKLEEELEKFLLRSDGNLPYFHPRYIAQMVKDPSLPTILGYLSFMLSNPNNHAYEGGPVTTEMEMEVVELLLKFIGFENGWGHLTSGGSLANLEALWVARDFYPEGAVYFSEVSHYSWKRICKILRINNFEEVPVDKNFRMDLNVLEEKLKNNPAMFVMANLGSTGTGSVDDIESILELKNKYNFHLHIDAAYGGFVRSVILDEDFKQVSFSDTMNLSEFVYRQLLNMSKADSITIDPHKHGLISYGAGAVMYRDEKLRAVVLNTAPYTYHKLDKPNIGMFSLEGSRPGAMAAACYLTYKVLPPNRTGIGKLINYSLSASKKFYRLLSESKSLRNLNYPDLDINCFYKESVNRNISEANKLTLKLYDKLSVESASPPFIISKFVTSAPLAKIVLPTHSNEKQEDFTSLRTVFIKHWNSLNNFYYVEELIKELEKN